MFNKLRKKIFIDLVNLLALLEVLVHQGVLSHPGRVLLGLLSLPDRHTILISFRIRIIIFFNYLYSWFTWFPYD